MRPRDPARLRHTRPYDPDRLHQSRLLDRREDGTGRRPRRRSRVARRGRALVEAPDRGRFRGAGRAGGLGDQRVAVWGARGLGRAPAHTRTVRGADPRVRQGRRCVARRVRRRLRRRRNRLRAGRRSGGPPDDDLERHLADGRGRQGNRRTATSPARRKGPVGAGGTRAGRAGAADPRVAGRRTVDDAPRPGADRRLPGPGIRRALPAAGRPLRRGRARSRWRGPPDARGGSPHRSVDVLPGHHPRRTAEDQACPDRTSALGGQGEAGPAVRGPRLSAPADRRDHRHDAGSARRRPAPFTDLPADRREADRRRNDPQYDLDLRLRAADDDGPAASAAPPLAALCA